LIASRLIIGLEILFAVGIDYIINYLVAVKTVARAGQSDIKVILICLTKTKGQMYYLNFTGGLCSPTSFFPHSTSTLKISFGSFIMGNFSSI
jgi:hypothetical protein